MSRFRPTSFDEAREVSNSRPQKPRTALKRGKLLSPSSGLNGSGRLKSASSGPIKAKGGKKKGRPKLRTMKSLKKLVWKHFSIHVRVSKADADGYVRCVTCPSSYLWNSGEIHAGHWMHGRLDYDERNVHPQCRNDNYFASTRVNTAYAVFMAKTYGVEIMEELELLGNTKGNRYTRDELEELLAHYRALNEQNPLVRG